MLRYVEGDLFSSGAECLINPVNCKGIMGRGLAEAFKKRFPAIMEPYQSVCSNGTLKPGLIQLIKVDSRTGERSAEGDLTIVNFPTKDDWRQDSRIEWIEAGLDKLALQIAKRGIRSVAIPKLGSGLGNLSWSEVRDKVEMKLAGLGEQGIDIMVYGEAPEKGRDVTEFQGEFRWMSNMTQYPVLWGDEITPPRIWECNELPYHLGKTLNESERRKLMDIYSQAEAVKKGSGAFAVKKAAGENGGIVTLRPDWKEGFCDDHMAGLVDDKVRRTPVLVDNLLGTGRGAIVEGNAWRDVYWGRSTKDWPQFGIKVGDGKNKLGLIFEGLRETLEAERVSGIDPQAKLMFPDGKGGLMPLRSKDALGGNDHVDAFGLPELSDYDKRFAEAPPPAGESSYGAAPSDLDGGTRLAMAVDPEPMRSDLGGPIPTTVINKKSLRLGKGDPLPADVVDISRYSSHKYPDGTPIGNPYLIGRDGSREMVVAKYARDLDAQLDKSGTREWMVDIMAGKKLACFCKPEMCHGDPMAAATNALVLGKDPHEAIRPFMAPLLEVDRQESKTAAVPGTAAGARQTLDPESEYYAGIGSRDTPPDVMVKEREIGRLMADRGMILRSGHAEGSDQAFEEGCDASTRSFAKEIFLPWAGFEGSKSKFTGPTREAMELGRKYHPAWDKLKQGAQKLHGRNSHQMLGEFLNSPVRSVVCWTKGGELSGGTSQALRIAADYGIPVINLGSPKWKDKSAAEIVDAAMAAPASEIPFVRVDRQDEKPRWNSAKSHGNQTAETKQRSASGYGESEPVAPRPADEETRKNNLQKFRKKPAGEFVLE